jgi:type I restriction enzyme S subunit
LSATAEESAAILSAGATRQRVNLQATAERYFALPPIDDQIKIVHHLAAVNEEFQPLLSSTNREITLIQEFRMRLIADVVTGKLDVRAAAARLPEATNVEIGDETIEPDEFAETDDLENEEAAA